MHEIRLGVAGIILWMLAAVLLVTIVTLSVIPASQANSLLAATHVSAVAADASISSAVQDAVFHCLFYAPFTLTLLLAAAWRPGLPPRRSRRAALLVILVVGSMSLLIEMAQAAWFGRSAELIDVVGNLVGMALGAALWRGIERAYPGLWEALRR